MIRPNYREFRRSKYILVSGSELKHSAKGSTWEDHKYIKRVDGTYYYPDSYEGGRHLTDEMKSEDNKKDENEKNNETIEESKSAVFHEYKEGDTDFDDPNLKSIGDTEFYSLEKPDGSLVIIEEDMKWVLPKGTTVTPELVKRLENFENNITELRKTPEGAKYSTQEWEKMATDAINGNTEISRKLSDKDIENLANEVIRGNFGVGQQRKELLGENYAEIQKRVNEIMKGSAGSVKVSTASKETIKNVDNIAKKVSNLGIKVTSNKGTENIAKNATDLGRKILNKEVDPSKKKTHTGVDMDKVMSVYKKKK